MKPPSSNASSEGHSHAATMASAGHAVREIRDVTEARAI